MSSKRYYWLKLNESFFEREEIKVIENMQNGKDYIIFYLKLLLKSIKTEGKLLFRDVIPYTPEMLASITGTSIDTVRVAIDMFTKLDLMEVWDDGTLFMVETQNMIGSESSSARRVRKHRERKALEEKQKNEMLQSNAQSLQSNIEVTTSNNEVIKSNTDIEIDIDKELDIDKDTYIEKEKELKKESLCMYDENLKNISKLYEENIGVITSLVAEQLKDISEEFPADLFKEALIIAVNRKKRYINYVIGILRNWKDNNILTIDDLEALRREKEIERQQKQQNKQRQNKQYNQPKKTKFHNFEQRTDKYSADQLDDIAERKMLEHLERLRNQNAL